MKSAIAIALVVAACSPGVPPRPAPSTPASTEASPSIVGTTRSADGTAIHYASIGAGRRAVVLVHCWGCSSREWDGTVAHLAPRTRVVAIDLAGHGESGRDRKQWTVSAFAADVRAAVEALGLERVVLVGHSMGGPVVVEAALAMSDKVAAIVPVDTLHDVSRKMTAEQRAAFFAPMHADFRGATEKLVRRLFPRDADPALVDRVVAQETAGDPSILVPAIENTFAWPEDEKLALVKVPVHAVNGDLFPTNVEANRKACPRYDATIVRGAGHWLMLEKPAAFYAALDETLAGVAW